MALEEHLGPSPNVREYMAFWYPKGYQCRFIVTSNVNVEEDNIKSIHTPRASIVYLDALA
jgi:hypothetical protein